MQNASSMHTEASAAKPGKVMIGGKAKYRFQGQIITLEHLIPNGTLLRFMVSILDQPL
jgi:hypothetical protein